MQQQNTKLGKAASLLAGLFFSFFLSFNTAFSGIFTPGERFMTFALIFLVYGLFGFLFGYLLPQKSWRWGYWLAGPAVLLAVLLGLIKISSLLSGLLHASLALASSCTGAYIGTGVRHKTRQHQRFPARGESDGE